MNLMSKDCTWAKEDPDIGYDPFVVSSPGDSQGTDIFCRPTANTSSVFMETTQSIAKVCRIDAIQKYSTTFDYFKRRCQICEYEQRGKKRVANVLLCLNHGIKACGIPRPPRSEEKRKLLVNGTNDPITDFTWMCDDSKGLTCMEKFHTFYLQQNLFKTRAINLKNAGTRVMFASIRMTRHL